jgi:hypothetical protein
MNLTSSQKKALSIAMCESLVDGWHGNWTMSKVIGAAWNKADIKPDSAASFYTEMADAIGVKHLYGPDKATTWIASNMKTLNEAMWAGRKTDTCIDIAKRAMGMRPIKASDSFLKLREKDTRNDWNTVK